MSCGVVSLVTYWNVGSVREIRIPANISELIASDATQRAITDAEEQAAEPVGRELDKKDEETESAKKKRRTAIFELETATQKAAAKGNVNPCNVSSKIVSELRVWMGSPELEKNVNMKLHMKAVETNEPVFMPSERLLTSFVNKIIELRYYKQHVKWVDKYIQTTSSTTTCAMISTKTVETAIRELINHIVSEVILLRPGDSSAYCSWSPEEASWCEDVFGIQICQSKGSHESIDFAAYGLPEIRVMLEGGEFVMGFHPEHIEGATLKDKVQALSNYSAVAAVALAKSKGFIAACPPGSAIITPAGCIMVSFPLDTTTDAVVLRWSFVTCDTAAVACLKLVKQFEECMPRLMSTGHFKALNEKLQSTGST